MSTGDAKRSQSAIAFSVLKKQGETSKQISNERAREEIEGTNPTVIISQVSTATITNETVDQNQNFLTASSTLGQKHNTDGLAIKLNRLKEKSARYVSHKDLLSQCIKSKFVLKGLELTHERTIGNFDQEFIDKQ